MIRPLPGPGRKLTRPRFLLSAAAAATVAGLLSACGGHQTAHTPQLSSPSSQSSQSSRAQTQTQTQTSPSQSAQSQVQTESVQSSQEWGPDNCMHTYVTSGGQTLSDTPTSLCRTAVTADNQTYYLVFPKDGSASNWLEEYGTSDDGYTYWRYGGLPWLRQASGDAEQILVEYSDGSTQYQDLKQWAASNSDGYPMEVKLGVATQGVARLMQQAYQAPLDSSQLTRDQLQEVQRQQQQREQQLQAAQQAQDNAQQAQDNNDNSQFLTFEYEYLTMENAREWHALTAPACDDDDTCAP